MPSGERRETLLPLLKHTTLRLISWHARWHDLGSLREALVGPVVVQAQGLVLAVKPTDGTQSILGMSDNRGVNRYPT